MKLTRYLTVRPDDTRPWSGPVETGIFMSAWSVDLLAKRLGLSRDEAWDSNETTHRWLSGPPDGVVLAGGEFWFTPEGDRLFRERSLNQLIARLDYGRAIVRKVVETDDIPGFETLIRWQDQHQVMV